MTNLIIASKANKEKKFFKISFKYQSLVKKGKIFRKRTVKLLLEKRLLKNLNVIFYSFHKLIKSNKLKNIIKPIMT